MLNLLICRSEHLYIILELCWIKKFVLINYKSVLEVLVWVAEISFVVLGSRQRKERLYHIDDTPSGVAEVIQDLDRSHEVSETCALVSYSSEPM
jgi:hypothetical protein